MSDTQTMTSNAVEWHELYTSDVDASIKFYSEVCGYTIQDMPMGEMGTYKMFCKDGKPFAGVLDPNAMGECPEGGGGDMKAPPMWATYLGVDDVDAALSKATALGANILVPAMEVPTVGRMGMIMDPQGAAVWFFKGTSESGS